MEPAKLSREELKEADFSDEEREYEDMTEALKTGSSELNIGELLHHQTFSLYDSMTAIELMDPKMDYSMIQQEPLTIAQAEKVLTSTPLSHKNILWVMEKVYHQKVLWMQGLSVAQSLYACLYLNVDIDYDKNELLQPFIDGVKFVSVHCYEAIRASICLRDDDYTPTNFNLTLPEALENGDVVAAEIARGEHHVNRLLKEAKKENDTEEIEVLTSILAHMRVQRALVKYMVELRKERIGAKSQFQESFDFAKKQLAQLKEFHTKIGDPVGKVFDTSLMVSLNISIAPRTIPELTFEEVHENLTRFVDDAKWAVTMKEYRNYHGLVEYLEEFASEERNLLSRALLELALFSQDKLFNQYPLREVLTESLTEGGLNAKAANGLPEFSSFMEKMVIVFKEYLLRVIKNKPRQRRGLGLYTQDLNIILGEADYIDEKLHGGLANKKSKPSQGAQTKRKNDQTSIIFNWCFYYVLRVMTKALLIGFELELYSKNEVNMIFFYLDFLFVYMDSNRTVIKGKFPPEVRDLLHGIGTSKKKVKISSYHKTVFNQVEWAQGMRLYSRGMFRMVSALMLRDVLPNPNVANDTLAQRYENRFKMFNGLQIPKRLTYEDFARSTQVDEEAKSEQILTNASETFQEAQKTFKRLSESEFASEKVKADCANMIKTCVANSLANTMFLKLEGNANIEFVNQFHRQAPVVKVTKK